MIGQTMKILAIGDPHIRRHAEFSQATASGLTEHLEAIQRTFGWLCALIETHQPDRVVCLGDVHDSPEGVDTQSMSVAARGWQDVSDACVAIGASLDFLVGNHDRYNEFVHTLEMYRWLGNVRVWDSPTLVEWGCDEASWRVLMLPWTKDPPDLSELFDEATDGLPAIAFSHQPLVGATIYGSTKEARGLRPADIASVVVQGHYHIPHRFENVLCPGSLNAKSFSDAMRPDDELQRGCVLVELDPSGHQETFLANPHSARYMDFRIPEELDVALEALADERARVRLFYRVDDRDTAEAVEAGAVGRARLVPLDSPTTITRTLPDDVDLEDPTAVVQAYARAAGVDISLLEAGLEVIKEAASAQVGGRCQLQPIRMRIKNFFSWEDVEVDLPLTGLILVEGDNGAGKTTFMTEAMTWCLSGDLTPRQNALADTCRRLENPADPESTWAGITEVAVTLVDVGSGREIEVMRRRGAKPDCELLINGVNVAGHRQASSQQQIEDELRMDLESLLAVAMLVDGFKSAFSRLTPAKRLAYYEKVLRLDVYERAATLAKVRRDEAKRAHARQEGIVDGVRQARDRVLSRLDDRAPTSLPTRRAQVAERCQAALAGIATQQAAAVTAKALAEADEQRQRELAEQARAAVEKTRPLVQQMEAQVRLKISEAEQWASAVRGLDEAITKHSKLLEAGRCHYCEQVVGESSTDHLASLGGDHSAAEGCRDAARAELSLYEGKLTRIRDKLTGYQGDERRAQQALTRAGEARRGAEAQISNLEGGVSALQFEVMTIDTQIIEAREELATAERTVTAAMEQAASTSLEIQRWDWWVSALGTGGLRLNVLGRALAETNERLASLAADLLDYGVALNNDVGARGQPGLDVQLTGTAKRLAGLSSGQRRAMDFCIQMGIADTAASRAPGVLKLLVCDEVLDTLDPANLGRVMQELERRARDHLVLVTAHNPSLRALVPDRWCVTMQADLTSSISR